MTKHRHRNSITGQFADYDAAMAEPATHVAEQLPAPVDLEAAAQRLYETLVPDAMAWPDLSQQTRDRYRAGARAVLATP